MVDEDLTVTTGDYYWDHRNRKAYTPISVTDEYVHFVSVWHEEEVKDALSTDTLIPFDEVTVSYSKSPTEWMETFRKLETDQLSDYIDAGSATSPSGAEES